MPPKHVVDRPSRLATARGAMLEALREGPGTLHDMALRCPEVSEHYALRALRSLVAEGSVEERKVLSPGSRQHAREYRLPGRPAPDPGVVAAIGRADDKALVLDVLRRASGPLAHVEVMAALPGLSHFRVRSALFGLEAEGLAVAGFDRRRKSSSSYLVRVYSPSDPRTQETAS